MHDVESKFQLIDFDDVGYILHVVTRVKPINLVNRELGD